MPNNAQPAVMPDVLRVNLGLPLTVLALMWLNIYAWLGCGAKN